MNVTPKPDTARLVIVGGWNANILLNHQWLSKYLFPENAELQIEWPLRPTFPGPPQISTDDIRIALTGPNLSFTPLKPSADLEAIAQLGVKLADYLPHTPVTAVGINFAFEGEVEHAAACGCFGDAASRIHEVLENFGGITERMHRYVLKSAECILNLSIRQGAPPVTTFDFNFHHEMSSLAQFKELVAEHPLDEYESKARAILDAITAIHENEGQT